MPNLFDNALQGISARFSQMSGGQSPFGNNPFPNGSPFANPFGSGGGPQFSGFGANGPNFGSPFGRANSPFGGNPFGGGSSPFGNPFGSGSSPFGGNPFGAIQNPYTYQPNQSDPFGIGGSGGPTTFKGGSSFSPSTMSGEGASGWVRQQRANSPLADIAPQITEYARSRGVDPGMLFGVLMKESQLASDTGMGTRQNNPGNIMAPGADPAHGKILLQNFPTMLDGVKAMVDLFANYGNTYGAKSVEDMIATYYVGPEAYKKYGLDANDAGGQGPGGNGTVRDYLEKFVYPTMQSFGAQRQTGAANRGNWEQTALSFTRQGGGWVDYTNGGIRLSGNPKDGFDCSSFTGYVLGLDKGIWNAQAQFDAAAKAGATFTNQSQAQKGDLIFFQGTTNDDPTARPVTHVGIYLGNGKMIHTGTPGRGVEIIDVSAMQPYFYAFGRL